MKTILIDSNYLCHQAKYSMGELSFRDSPTGIIFGFLGRILSLGKMMRSNQFVFCWDSRKSWRKEIYPEYKSHRHKDKTEEEMVLDKLAFKQFNELKDKVLSQIGFSNVLVRTGFEADDIMAKVCHQELETVVIVSADEDLYQLLSETVSIYQPSKKRFMTVRTFKQEYGIKPAQWVQVKSIAGCTSDNVKGVGGVGEKTAIEYLNGNLKTASAKFNVIRNSPDIVKRNEVLVKLPFKFKTHVLDEIDTEINTFSISKLERVCKEYGMMSFLKEDRKKEWENFFSGEVSVEKKAKFKFNERE